jgi:hypothetical protein
MGGSGGREGDSYDEFGKGPLVGQFLLGSLYHLSFARAFALYRIPHAAMCCRAVVLAGY